ncbi:uncharacterized protein BP5553_03672 [Venustampulla echinocandica]|uniref:DUF6594 domain-containing protein n=1 Tax=Venustampulla echinocandica TaxID=2656787 RepID=A0A370TUX1_9HELO|nr:uncharacterized protein BP5553_03672 [Venustampulla echinocandica]RDL39332.1 hypothetical protein BP5553_03672 [Venustampulla echinocandica]
MADELSLDLKDKLDLMSLHFWAECCALICTACKPDDMTYTRSMLARNTVVEHLQSFHNFTSDLQMKALEKCLDMLPYLALHEGGFIEPRPDMPPRPFLPPPRRGWSCAMCNFCTDDFRENKWHFGNRHASTFKWNEFTSQQVTVQHVDGIYFPVLVEDPIPTLRKVQPSLVSGLPRMLHYWSDCHAIVCVGCDDAPILSRNDILSHIQCNHSADEQCQDLNLLEDKLQKFTQLAKDPSEIRLPRPYLGDNPFLPAAFKGWTCSHPSCGFASDTLHVVETHKSIDHPEFVESSSQGKQVMLQYVTLSGQRIWFPVDHLEPENEFPTVFRLPEHPIDEDNSEIQIPIRAADERPSSATLSSASGGWSRPVARNAPITRGSPFKDTYTDDDRKEIMASLWDHPSPSDLEALDRKHLLRKIRELTLRDNTRAIKEVRMFHNVYLQAILQTQHEIIQFEERMSREKFGKQERLSKLLIEYADLIKSYRGLASLKQIHKDDRSFAKFFATELHEPRYWYAPDASELIDIGEESPRMAHDIVRKILQQKLPAIFLDAAGKSLREIDEFEPMMEDRGGKFRVSSTITTLISLAGRPDLTIQIGAISTIAERYRRHGRYISPSVDNFARVIFAVTGGLFLLAPMVALSYITSKTYLIITTVLFVLVFAACLGLLSKGSNHELIGATAAYAAVLVVFVGNSIGPGSNG